MTRFTHHPHSFDSLCTRAGIGQIDGTPLETPIVQSTTFCRGNMANQLAHAYSRVSNPTVLALETALGDLEKAPPAVAFSTGLAAETALFVSLLRHGDHIVCGRAVYGGTTRLLEQVFSGLGVEVTFVDATKSEAVADAIRANTRLVFVETPANPTLEITDIQAVADVTHDAGILLAVDNTFMTAVLQQPFDFGADLSVYSTTKWIDGHSVALGGAIVSRNEKLLERLRFIRKSTGGIQTPFGAWLTLQGFKTLPIRLRRQSETAAEVAQWLDKQPNVLRTYYPTLLESAAQRSLAEKQHLGYHGAVVTFDLDGGLSASHTFLNRLKFCRLVEHIGGAETLVTHPASMTHADVSPKDRLAVGITDGLVRVSIGLEDAEEIIADLAQAIEAAAGTAHKHKEAKPCAVAG